MDTEREQCFAFGHKVYPNLDRGQEAFLFQDNVVARRDHDWCFWIYGGDTKGGVGDAGCCVIPARLCKNILLREFGEVLAYLLAVSFVGYYENALGTRDPREALVGLAQ